MTNEHPSLRCCRALVSGRVQGVGFRMATRAEALRLGVRGYAANLPDGCVEVCVCGEAEPVQRLLDWLERGPPSAQVSEVKYSDEHPAVEAVPSGFGIR